MILIDNNFRKRYAGAVKKARAERIRVVRLENDLYYVSRRDTSKPHGQYLVRFLHKSQSVTAVCATIFNEACRGCWQGRCCAHIAAAYERAVQHGFRINRQEAA